MFVLGLSNFIISARPGVEHLHCSSAIFSSFLVLLIGILLILCKSNFFIQVVCLEVSLILVLISSLTRLQFIWCFLLILGLGATEGSLALALAVHLSRTVNLCSVSI